MAGKPIVASIDFRLRRNGPKEWRVFIEHRWTKKGHIIDSVLVTELRKKRGG